MCIGCGCLLASCSQDHYIRLWRVSREGPDRKPADSGELKLTEDTFSLMDHDGVQRKYSVTLESVLIGNASGGVVWVVGGDLTSN